MYTGVLLPVYRYRIGPYEVESALMDHPAVLEAAVVGSPDELRGEVHILMSFYIHKLEYYKVQNYYRAIHFSAKRGLAIACRLSVRPSVYYRRSIRRLDQFHRRCLRKIACVKWQDRIPNTDVLNTCAIMGIEAFLLKAQCKSYLVPVKLTGEQI